MERKKRMHDPMDGRARAYLVMRKGLIKIDCPAAPSRCARAIPPRATPTNSNLAEGPLLYYHHTDKPLLSAMQPWAVPRHREQDQWAIRTNPSVRHKPTPPVSDSEPTSATAQPGYFVAAATKGRHQIQARRRSRQGRPRRAHRPRCRWSSTGARVRDGGGAAASTASVPSSSSCSSSASSSGRATTGLAPPGVKTDAASPGRERLKTGRVLGSSGV